MKIDLDNFARQTLEDIPLLRHMQLRFCAYDSGSLTLEVPLAPNINDKQTAFGGSIVTLATVCGWALVSLITREANLTGDVMIVDSEMSYRAPINGDFLAVATISTESRQAFLQDLHRQARSKVKISVSVMQETAVKAVFTGKYVAKAGSHYE